jgi:glutathione S-transferase
MVNVKSKDATPLPTSHFRPYVDLSLFQMIEGLRYAFPRAMTKQERKHRGVIALHNRVTARPRLAAYLASERRLPFNQEGIFRHYPELDDRS